MPEVYETEGVAKIRCFGRPEALDALKQPAATLRGRIAPDEVVFVGAPGTADALRADLEGQLAGEGAAALVVDHTDGWAFFTIRGDDRSDVIARITAIDVDGADRDFLMGRICDVAGKAFVRPGRFDLMCGAEAAQHVRHRIEHAGHLQATPAPSDDPIGVTA